MTDLLALTRMMKLYYHHLHNIAHGVSFEGDHEIMLEFYEAMDTAYDSLIERYIGLGGEMNKEVLLQVITEAHAALEQIPEGVDMESHFKYALQVESLLRAEIEIACEMASKGTENMLAQLADESEVRSYKLKQRIG